jgi:hypothetical protein
MSPISERPPGAEAPPERAEDEEQAPAGQEIDVQVLADKVYKLLKRDLVVERERLGWKRRW